MVKRGQRRYKQPPPKRLQPGQKVMKMNRWVVVEALVDHDDKLGDMARFQLLGQHASVTGAYLNYPSDELHLQMFDIATGKVYLWSEVFRLMCFEQVTRVINNLRLTAEMQVTLLTMEYLQATLDSGYQVTDKGRELLEEFAPLPTQKIEIGHIKSTSILHR